MANRVTLDEVLAAKETRRAKQNELRQQTGLPVVSITINMPGSIKDFPVLRQLCDYAVDEVKARLNVVAEQRVNPVTGPEALLAVAGEADQIKAVTVAIEEAEAFGRLLDIDVFDAKGELLSRQQAGQGRYCLVCSQPVIVCMRERRHSEEQLLQAVWQLLDQFRAHLTHRMTSRRAT